MGSTEQSLQIGAKRYRVLRADMVIERAHVPEDFDQLKVIGCRVLGDQGEGLHSGIFATILDETNENLLERWSHVLRIHVDMRDHNDFAKPRRRGRVRRPSSTLQRSVAVSSGTYALDLPPTCFDALGALLV